jgi:hypothetical protein
MVRVDTRRGQQVPQADAAIGGSIGGGRLIWCQQHVGFLSSKKAYAILSQMAQDVVGRASGQQILACRDRHYITVIMTVSTIGSHSQETMP